jgi:hypothetical protein
LAVAVQAQELLWLLIPFSQASLQPLERTVLVAAMVLLVVQVGAALLVIGLEAQEPLGKVTLVVILTALEGQAAAVLVRLVVLLPLVVLAVTVLHSL